MHGWLNNGLGTFTKHKLQQAATVFVMLLNAMLWAASGAHAGLETLTYNALESSISQVVLTNADGSLRLEIDLSDGNNNGCLTQTAGIVNVRLLSSPFGCQSSAGQMEFTSTGFQMGPVTFNNLRDFDANAARDSMAANVAGTWTSPDLDIGSLTNPPSGLNQTGRLTAVGGVGTFVYNAAGAEVNGGDATFAPATPTNNFSIFIDDVQGGRNILTSFGFASLIVDVPDPSLAVTKSAAAPSSNLGANTSIPDAGDTITYSIEVVNDGETEMNGAAPSDAGPTFNGQPAAGSLSAFSPATADLGIGESQTFTATYTLQQADIDNIAQAPDPSTAVENTATVTATPPGADPFTSDPSSDTTGLTPVASYALDKTATGTVENAGDTLTYSMTATNTGNVSLTNIVVADAKCAAAPVLQSGDTNANDALEPSETWIYTCTSIPVTQAEVDAGQVDNTATIDGQDPNGTTVAQGSGTNSTPITPAPAFSMVKSTTSTPAAAGDTLDYTFAVTNDGNVSINAVSITDAKCAATPVLDSESLNADGVLEYQEVHTYTCTSIPVTQAEVDAGAVDNSATANGTPAGGTLTPAPATNSTPITPAPAFSMVKSTTSTPAAAGDTLDYTFAVTNDGNVSINAVSITDAKCAAAPVLDSESLNADGVLEYQEVHTYTCTSIPVTQAEVDAGAVDNSATANGTPAGGTLTPAPATNSTPITPAPAFSMVKSTTSTPAAAGDTLDYTFAVTNDGNVSISNVSITDAKCAATPVLDSESLNADGVLEYQEVHTYTCTSIPVTQAEVDAGAVDNSATANGTPAGGTLTPAPATNSTPITPAPAFSMVKSTTSTPAAAGDTLDYTFAVTNDGNVSISNVSITDAKCAATPVLDSESLNADGVLEYQEVHTYTCTSIPVTQAEVDAGAVDNSATANGTPAGGTLTPAPATNSTPITPAPAFSMVKSTTSTPAAAGDTLDYTFAVTNDGNVSINAVSITDAKCAATPVLDSESLNADGVLEYQEVHTYTCTSIPVTQAEVDAGAVDNSATANGTPAGGTLTPAPATNSTPITPAPAMSMLKSTSSTPVNPGDTLTYTFQVFNDGNVSINAVAITDAKCAAAPTLDSESLNADGVLEFGENQTYSCTSIPVTQAEVDAGTVDNSASATGTPEGGTLPPAPATNSTPITSAPAFSMVKSTTSTPLEAGQTLDYTFEVTNDGNVSISGIAITDAKCAAAPVLDSESISADTVLEYQEVHTYTCTSIPVTQAEVDAGQVDNSATANGTPAGGTLTPAPATNSTPITPAPAFSMVKGTTSTPMQAGDTLNYTFDVTNDGNVSINAVSITDAKCAAAPVLDSESISANGILDFQEVHTYTCTSVPVTQAEVDAGTVDNSATATGTPEGGVLPPAPASNSTPIAPAPAFTLVKSTSSVPTQAGDTLDYSFAVENTGNVSINSPAITDAKCAAAPTLDSESVTADGVLEFQEVQTYTCTSIPVTQAEVDAGAVDNTATLSGTPEGGVLPPVQSGTSTPVTPQPAFSMEKSTVSTPTEAGQTLEYTFEVTNDGNVSINGVAVADAKCAAAPVLDSESISANGILDFQEVHTYTCTSVPVTQAEVDAGTVDNSATATGTPEGGTLDPAPADNSTPIAPAPAFSMVKSSASTPTKAGDVLVYDFEVTNDGNVSITGVTLTDAKCNSAVSLTNESISANGVLDFQEVHTYTCTSIPVTQAEADAGTVDNTVTVTGTPAGGTLAPATGSNSTPIAPDPSMTLDKKLRDGGPTSYDAVGQVLLYDFIVENTGNITLTTPVTISDLALDGPADCSSFPAGGLAPNETMVCTGEVTVTQQDIDDGSHTNTATASSGPTSSPSDTVVVDADQNPELTIVKEATEPAAYTLGQEIEYTYTITNTGNTTSAFPISVDDNRTPVSCPVQTEGLAPISEVPTAQLVCTATYTITLQDTMLGTVTNVATATDGVTTSASDSQTTPNDREPAISLAKAATAPDPLSFTKLGDPITYSYTLKNTGGVGFTGAIQVTDDKIDNGTPFDCWVPTGADPTFDPDLTYGLDPVNNTDGEEFTCTRVYNVSQEDVDAGFVTNEAIADTDYLGTPVASEPKFVTVNATANPELTMTKSVDPTDLTTAAVGDVLTYTFTAQNTGDVTLDDVVPVDTGPTFNGAAGTGAFDAFTVTTGPDGNSDGKADTLAPNDSAEFTATYTLTQDDIDAAAAAADPLTAIANSATGAATPRNGTLPPVTPTTAETGFTPEPAFTVTKSTTSAPTKVDDTLEYSFFVENTGNVSITAVTVTDAKCAATPTLTAGDLDADGALDVTEVHTYTCTSIAVTQDEVDAGMVDNEVTVTGTPAGGILAPAEDDISTPITSAPAFSMVKATTSTPTAAGQTLDYTFEVTNDGNVSINTVAVTDAKCAAAPVLDSESITADGILEYQEVQTYTCTSIPVTQAEVDAGKVDNAATATGKEPDGTDLPPTDATNSTPIVGDPLWSVEKATVSVPTAAGDTLDYTFIVNNDGNVSISNVVLADAKCAAAPVLTAGGDANADTRLNPDEVWEYTCTSIPVTQAEIDAGMVDNDVSVTGTDPTGTAMAPATDTLSTPVTPMPSWTVGKSTASTPAAAGDTLEYDFVVTNTGNVSVSAVNLVDAKCAAAPVLKPASDTGSDLVLSPTEAWEYTCTSIPVTQAEVDAGMVDNTATATGTPAGGTLPPAEGQNSTPIASTPGLNVVKSTASTPVNAGDTLEYSFEVTNTGNTSINPVTVTDAKCDTAPALTAGGDANTDGALNPTETWVYTCTSIAVTQDEVDAGVVTNDVSVGGTDAAGGAVPPATDELDTPIAPAPAWSVVKATATVPAAEGDTLDYTFTVNNDGNVSISSITIADAKCAATPVLTAGGDADTDTELDPTEVWEYTCTSIPITQAEVDAGVVENSVVLMGQDPTNTPMAPAEDTLQTPVPPAPAIEAQKAITSTTVAVGETVTFEIEVKNTGNVTLTGVAVTDTLKRADGTDLTLATGPTFIEADQNSTLGTLLVNETATYEASYVLTQEDIDAGGINNSATATGSPPTGADVSDISDDNDPANGDDNPVVLDIPADPDFTMLKALAQVTKADGSTASSFDAVGDRLDYTFTITNTGNVTLTDPFSITDAKITDAGGTIICEEPPLAPLDTLECTGSFVITQDELDAGLFENSATATDGSITTEPSDVTVNAVQLPAMEIAKTARPIDPDQFVVGAEVTYDYLVTNTGNVTITEPITINDNLITDPANITCDAWPGSVAPGATYACVGVYTVTSDDVDLASATNVADATDGTTTSPPVAETVPSGADPALTIEKTSVDTTFAMADDILTYSFKVINSGTQAFVNPINVVDDRIGTIECWAPVAGSDPDFTAGEEAICSAPYTVTQDDMDAGTVTNNAYANTTFGGGTDVVSPPDAVTIDADVNPAMDLTKTVALPAGKTTEDLVVGDVLTYTLPVENTGNQTLTNITVSDPLLGLNCSIANLPVETTDSSCTGTYTLEQSDIDAGKVDNEASATGSNPAGGTVEDDAELSTPMPTPKPELELTKSATPNPFGAVGSSVTYTLAVTNKGNVTLRDIEISDPLIPSLACTVATLAPTMTDSTCKGIYTVQQADVDAGEIENTGSALGQTPAGVDVPAQGTAITPGPEQTPALEVTKTLSSTGTTPGKVVTFTIAVENTGNVTLSNVTPTDTLTRNDAGSTQLALDAPGLQLTSGDINADNKLDVTETWIYTGQYTLVQADVNQGGITNVAVVDATDPNDDPVSDTSDNGNDTDGNTEDDPTVFTIVPGPQIEATKVISEQTGVTAGSVLTFDISVANTGNIDLNNITLDDVLTRADGTLLELDAAPQLASGDTSNAGFLDVDEIWVYQAEYTLQQADIDAGGIQNVVTATAADPNDPNTTVSDLADNGTDSDGNTVDDPTVFTVAPMPMIEAEKTVRTPAVAVEETVTFAIKAINTGNVTLTPVTFVDTLTRADGTVLTAISEPVFESADQSSAPGTLLPGETATYTATYTLVQEDLDAGGISNTVTANGIAPNGALVSDVSDDPNALADTGASDPAILSLEQNPSLALAKTVVSERKLFPTIYEATFEITALNDGNVTQTNIQLVDDLAAFAAPATVLSVEYPAVATAADFTDGTANAAFDGVGNNDLLSGTPTLAPTETGTVTVTVTYSTANGFPAPGVNTVTASSDQSPNPDPATATITNVDADGDGSPDSLESDTEDRDGDGIADASDYDPTGYFYCEEDGRILTGGLITVSGNGFTQTGVGTTGSIIINQDGTNGFYQFNVTAAGTYTMSYTLPTGGVASTTIAATTTPTDVTNLVDVLTGTSTTDPRILGSSEFGATGQLADFTPAANPAFYTSFVIEAGDPNVFSNNIPLQACTAPADLTATKAVIGRTDVNIGDLVTYQIDFDLGATGGAMADLTLIDMMPTGISYVANSATIAINNGAAAAVEPAIAGRKLTWTGQTIPVGGKLTVQLNGRVMPNAPTGKLVNQAYAQTAAGTRVSNTAEATVERIPEHVFDCSDVIGKVFDDRNHNGYQDGPNGSRISDQNYYGGKGKVAANEGGEPGLAGVRVVTVKGTRITTDEYGRFHVPCAELPRKGGTNFILKVDERSLPTGYRVTTENPRVVRLTAGKFAKVNFGASISNVIRIDLNKNAFAGGLTTKKTFDQALRNMVAKMKNKPSVVRLTYVFNDGADQATARKRVAVVERMIKAEWRKKGQFKLNIERTIKRRQ